MNQSLMGTSMRDVGRDINKLSRDNKKLERNLNTIGTPSDTEQFRLKLRDDIHETTSLVKQLLSCIQDLKSQDTNNDNIKLQRLEKQFLEQYTKLSSVTKTIKTKLQSTKPHSNKRPSDDLKNPFLENTSIQNRGGYDLGNIDMDNLQTQYENHLDIPPEEEEQAVQQTQAFIPEFDGHIAELEDREEAIHQMAEDLTELNSMYKDLKGLVDEQGEQIEVLSSNVENAREDVKSGVIHLDKASKHQRKYRKKMCIILMIFLVMAAILTLVIYYSNKGNKK